jgi:site-specific recombinase XerD
MTDRSQLALLDLATQMDTGSAPGNQVLVDRDQLRQFMALFAEATVGRNPPKLSEHQKAQLYLAAFDEWLRRDPKKGRERPAATIEAYTTAWEDFRQFCGKDLWRVQPSDVRAWIGDLRERIIDPAVARGLVRNRRRTQGQIGLSESSIAQYLAAISSFYSFAATYPVEMPDETTIKLFDGVNPVKASGVPRPQSKPFEDATFLDSTQLSALLNAISRWTNADPKRHLQGLRDYAIFHCYILTGGRSSEVRVWRWQDLRQQGGAWQYYWDNKGKKGWQDLPADAFESLHRYLTLAGRWGNLQPDDYLFTPLTDAVMHLKHIQPDDWSRNRALSGHEIGRLLKRYGDLAGLDPDLLHVHTLRHSAYMLYTEAGVDVRYCSKLLHHSSLATTTNYDHVMVGQRNTEWRKAAALLTIQPPLFPYNIAPTAAQCNPLGANGETTGQ